MTINSTYNIVKYSSAISVLIPLICCIIKYKTLNTILRVLFLYLLLSAMSEVIGFYLLTNNIRTYIVQNSFTLIESTLILIIYYRIFDLQKIKKLITFFYSLYFILSIYILFFKNGFDAQDNILNTIESSFFMFLAYFYFYRLMQRMDVAYLTEYYFTWINTAFLIYFSAGFVMFLFNEYIENFYIQLFYLVYCLYLITSIAFNIILSVGIWKIKHN